MKPTGRFNLAADVRDLQIVDKNDEGCGIVDDIEFEGAPGETLRIKALLVGPGTYGARLPGWLAWLMQKLAGKGLVRVPWDKVEAIGSVVRLAGTASELGLGRAERKARRALERWVKIDALH